MLELEGFLPEPQMDVAQCIPPSAGDAVYSLLGAVFSAVKQDGLLQVRAQVCRATMKCINTLMHVHTSIENIQRLYGMYVIFSKREKNTPQP